MNIFGGSKSGGDMFYPELETPTTEAEFEAIAQKKSVELDNYLKTNEGWTKINYNDTGDIELLELTGAHHPTVKVTATIPATPKAFFDLVRSMDLTLCKTFDNNLKSATVHKVVKEGVPFYIEICRTTHNTPMPVTNREIVYIRAYRVDPDGTHYQVQTSINSKDFPNDSNYVRAVAVITGYVARPHGDGTSCKVTRVSCFDPKGSIPGFIQDKFKANAANMLANMRTYIEKQKK